MRSYAKDKREDDNFLAETDICDWLIVHFQIVVDRDVGKLTKCIPSSLQLCDKFSRSISRARVYFRYNFYFLRITHTQAWCVSRLTLRRPTLSPCAFPPPPRSQRAAEPATAFVCIGCFRRLLLCRHRHASRRHCQDHHHRHCQDHHRRWRYHFTLACEFTF